MITLHLTKEEAHLVRSALEYHCDGGSCVHTTKQSDQMYFLAQWLTAAIRNTNPQQETK